MLVASIVHKAAFGPISYRITIPASIPFIFYRLSQRLESQLPTTRFYTSRPTMGKKKSKSEYNDFLDGEKLRDNADIRTSLQAFPAQDNSSVSTGQHSRGSKKRGKNAGKKPQLTHFLCLPLVTDTSRLQLQQGLEKFKQDLINDNSVPVKAVRPVGTLHLTLGVMSLNPRELEEAKQYLEDLDLHALLRDITHRRIAEKAAEQGIIGENLTPASMPDTDAMTINLEALVPMQAPHKTSILYAEPRDPSLRLPLFAAALRDQFTERGLMVADTRPLKLHATIMNTIYAKPKASRGRSKTAKLKHGLKYVEHRISPHHKSDGDGDENDGENDGASMADSVDGDAPTLDDSSIVEGGQNQALPARGEGHGPDAKSWMRFDARNLIEKYKDYVWARNVRVDRVCICEMGAKKIWSGTHEGEGEVLDEQYKVISAKGIFE
jgi:activating signal cointegrator complex subunit 1